MMLPLLWPTARIVNGTATVTVADITTDNRVVHVTDAVILLGTGGGDDPTA